MGIFSHVKQKILLIQGQTWPNIRKKSSSGERDLWWPSLIRYHIASLTILAAMALPLKIANCNKNQIPSNLCQSRTLICCQPSWITIITRNRKMSTMALPLIIETCSINWSSLNLGQSSTWICCLPSWIVTIIRNFKNGLTQHHEYL